MNDKLLETLQSIGEFQECYMYSPTLKDLSGRLGLSEAGVSLRIKQLIEEGCLERLGNRALKITVKGMKTLEQQDGLFPTEGKN